MGILGRGRFSEVIRGEDGSAIKVIDVDSQKKPHSWKAELAALKALANCPNIVQVLHTEERLAAMDPEVRITMPYYELTLEHVVYAYAKASYPPGSGWRNVMPAAVIKRIGLGISRALNAVHDHQIIHRDLKPENIMFSSVDSEPVLIDFGIAWVPSQSASQEPPNSREVDVATGEYKAPELLYGIRDYSEKVDMWSLGCILCRMLTSDCKPLFTPYMSDIRLIAAQFDQLGRPDINDCPSLQNTVAANFLGVKSGPEHELKLRNVDDHLKQLALQLLSFEPTKRPSAQNVVDALNQ